MVIETKIKFVDGGLSIMQILHTPSQDTDSSSDSQLKKDAAVTRPPGTTASTPETFVKPASPPAAVVVSPAKKTGEKGGSPYGSTDPGGGGYGSTDPGGGGKGFGGVTIIFGNLTAGCCCVQGTVAPETDAPANGANQAQQNGQQAGNTSDQEKPANPEKTPVKGKPK